MLLEDCLTAIASKRTLDPGHPGCRSLQLPLGIFFALGFVPEVDQASSRRI